MFDGEPARSEDQHRSGVLQTEITDQPLPNIDKIHDNSKASNIVPIPPYLYRREWTRKSGTDVGRQYRLRSSMNSGRKTR